MAQPGTDTETPPPPAEPSLRFDLDGYYRIRGTWIGNTPILRGTGAAEGKGAVFAFQRLRAEPKVIYGFGGDDFEARLSAQIDALDNVVFGDNSRRAAVPLFAASPSSTSVLGTDEDTIQLKRVWLELMTPVGLLGVGRMPLGVGLQILSHDGNGLSEWGDPLYTDSVDMVYFATQPLTIFNALATGDRSPTPFISSSDTASLSKTACGIRAKASVEIPRTRQRERTSPTAFSRTVPTT